MQLYGVPSVEKRTIMMEFNVATWMVIIMMEFNWATWLVIIMMELNGATWMVIILMEFVGGYTTDRHDLDIKSFN